MISLYKLQVHSTWNLIVIPFKTTKYEHLKIFNSDIFHFFNICGQEVPKMSERAHMLYSSKKTNKDRNSVNAFLFLSALLLFLHFFRFWLSATSTRTNLAIFYFKHVSTKKLKFWLNCNWKISISYLIHLG